MSNNFMTPIDGEKLDRLLQAKHVSKKAASLAIGCYDGYLTRCIYRGSIGIHQAFFLEKKYRIKADSYCSTKNMPKENKAYYQMNFNDLAKQETVDKQPENAVVNNKADILAKMDMIIDLLQEISKKLN